MPIAFRDRIPALVLVGLLHVLAVYAFLHAIIIEHAPRQEMEQNSETQIALMREAPAPQPQISKHRKPAAGGSTAITLPFFNPYTYTTPFASQGSTEGISTALSACDPGRYDMASAEVRVVCDRIGALIKNDPGHFGFTSDVTDPMHWNRELARREAPHLLPCMKAHSRSDPRGGVAMMVDLQTLLCVSRILFIGYDSEKNEHYSK
jgi:hypothetical protein